MSINSQLVEQIVQQVLREISSRQTTGARPVAASAKADDGLLIQSKVITEEVLVGAGASGRLVRLVPGSVITPTGRDYIRKHGVRLSSSLNGIHGGSTTGTGEMLQVKNSQAAATAAGILNWKLTTVADERSAAAWILKERKSGPVFSVGGDASVIACLLNRNRNIRAAVVTRPTSVESLRDAMNPNVYCCDGVGWSAVDVVRSARCAVAKGCGVATGGAGSAGAVPGSWKELDGETER
ncbi:MAG: hypothetical protein JNL58_00905 [Planctomyces sp.]|nr:hypothetical protein [Planctomyces sp.]